MAEIIPLNPTFERLSAKHRQYNEVIVFVHHYAGHRHSFMPTMQWLNELGFDVVTFDMPHVGFLNLHKLPVDRRWKFGMRHIWADRIEDVLGGIVQKKFIFSYSMPSVGALMAIERRHAIDIKGWVCEGGPFTNLLQGIYNLFNEGKVSRLESLLIRNPRLRRRLAEAAAFRSGAWNYNRDAKEALLHLPDQFPILSLRSSQDSLVTPDMIDDFFQGTESHLEIEKVMLRHGNHLQGFKNEPALYKEYVSGFLLHHATRV